MWQDKMKILITNGIILTMDKDRRIIKDGAVAIGDGKIQAVGKTSDIKKSYSGDKTIDATGFVVMPGFINTHVHMGMTIQRGLGEYLTLLDRLNKTIFPVAAEVSKEEAYLASTLGYIESIKAGVTCCNDIILERYTDRVIQAAVDVGIRADVGKNLSDIKGIGPKKLIQETNKAIRESKRLIRKWNNALNERIRYRLCPQFVASCTDELLEKVADLSRKFNLGIHTHTNQDWDLLQMARKRTGMSEIEYLDTLGLTGPRSIFAHCVHVSTRELKILSRTKTCVSYSPVIPTKTGAGIAPIAWLVRNGVTVGLGTDSAGLDTNQDIFEEMRMAGALQRGSFLDPTALPSEKLLEMATIDGAKALSLDNKIGSIEKGKKADIILVNFRKPHLKPNHKRLISHLVWAAYPSDVETTIVDGKIVMENRILQTVDEPSVLEKVDKMAEGVLKRVGYEEKSAWPWE